MKQQTTFRLLTFFKISLVRVDRILEVPFIIIGLGNKHRDLVLAINIFAALYTIGVLDYLRIMFLFLVKISDLIRDNIRVRWTCLCPLQIGNRFVVQLLNG